MFQHYLFKTLTKSKLVGFFTQDSHSSLTRLFEQTSFIYVYGSFGRSNARIAFNKKGYSAVISVATLCRITRFLPSKVNFARKGKNSLSLTLAEKYEAPDFDLYSVTLLKRSIAFIKIYSQIKLNISHRFFKIISIFFLF